MEKLGLLRLGFSSPAMVAGTHWERRVLDYLGIQRRDRQIKSYKYRVRVNLDGEDDAIHEVKTFSAPEFKLVRAYWLQSQVEMRFAKKTLIIEAYRLTEEDYKNFYRDIDPQRLFHIPVEYDAAFVDEQYLPRVSYLKWCLKKRLTPNLEDLNHTRGGQ